MLSSFGSQKITRRGMLRAGALLAGMSAIPLLQACSGQPAASTPAAAPTTAAAKPTTAAAAPTTAPTAAPTTAPTAAPTTAAAGTTPTAAAAAAATPSAAATTTTSGTLAPQPTPGNVAAISPSSVKITGKLSILQERDYNPIHNQNIHDEITAFAKQNNWDLDLSYMEAFVGGSDFYQKMAAAVASNTAPDFIFGTKDAFLLHNGNMADPVDDVVNWAKSNYGDPIKGIQLANVLDGHWYGVPFFTRTGGDFARKSWFAPANFDIEAPHNLQDFLDVAVQLSDPAKKRWIWGRTVNRSGDGESDVHQVVFGAGGRYTDESGEKVVFNSDETIAAYQWLYDLYGPNSKYAKALPPGVNGWSDTSNNQAWIAGTIGFTNNAGTLFAQAVKQTPDIAKDSFLVPTLAGPVGQKQRLASAGGATMNLMHGAKNPDAAKATMEYLLNQKIQKQIWSTSSGYACPAYAWGWDEPEVTGSTNNVDKIFQQIAYGEQFFDWMPGPAPKLWVDAIGNAVVLTETMAEILKGTDIKTAVADGHKKIQALHDQYQGK